MSARYDALERLQRLRQSGALTDAEFEIEKKRLLGHEPAAGPTDLPTLAEGRPRWPLYAIIGLFAVVVAAAIGAWVGFGTIGRNPAMDNASAINAVAPDENVAAADENLIAPPTPADPRTLPPQEQLDLAKKAVFGTPATAPAGGGNQSTDASVPAGSGRSQLLPVEFGPVLASEAPGAIGLYYLRADNGTFQVVARYPDAVRVGASPRIARWRVSNLFGDLPVVYAEANGGSQGATCTTATLTEIGPNGPAPLATIVLAYAGSSTDQAGPVTLHGRLGNIVRNQSFEIVYSGSQSFTEHYVRTATGFALDTGKSQVPSC